MAEMASTRPKRRDKLQLQQQQPQQQQQQQQLQHSSGVGGTNGIAKGQVDGAEAEAAAEKLCYKRNGNESRRRGRYF
ncbi:hypothetical protein ACLKA6_005350 [Drosophila palustris]